ncbi:MAG: sterol desaturase family protein [Proteobacteria bacterium]|nr:sterol desaturase family protein [Pseudomonadota bacterium]
MEYLGISAFLAIALITLGSTYQRGLTLTRDFGDWFVDISSLIVHFFILPVVGVTLVYKLLDFSLPNLKGSISSTPWTNIGLYLVIDYAWYWNHRIFHADTPLWHLHSTHHKPVHIDVFITARNALLSHFAMVYLWLIGAASYILDDATFFMALVAFGTVVNLWGHSHLNLKTGSFIERIVSALIVTPRDHAWHHSRENSRCNFGTVFNVWDKLHGTIHRPKLGPNSYGDASKTTIWRQLFWPF